jgi:hypothetical protein
MENMFWWDTHKDDGCVNSILKFSVEVRKWYLQIDVKVRLKRFILFNADFEEIIQLWKRLQIVKKDFGEEAGSRIIQQALKEIKDEFSGPDVSEIIKDKIAIVREKLSDDYVTMI